MQERFEHNLFNELGLNKTDRIICAVSGGADSIAMLHLFRLLKMNICVAHCNFQLRGLESDNDASFVKKLCSDSDILFYSKSFDTHNICVENQSSIQETARDLRYRWFEELRSQLNFDYVATAHNLTDNLETVLINQIRGTDISGLQGIPIIREKIIRPLIIFSSKEIRSFNKKNSFPYRNDSSNSSSKYLRNKIRQKIFEPLLDVEPLIEQRYYDNSKRIKETGDLYKFLVNQTVTSITREKSGTYYIPISELNSYPHHYKILYSFLNRYGFTENQLKDFLKSTNVGSFTLSPTHQIVRDRNDYVISVLSEFQSLKISQEDTYTFGKYQLIVELIRKTPDTLILPSSSCYLKSNFDKLSVRTWQNGDRICPLGMSGSKLISDLFIDQKTSKIEKETLPLLVCNNEIVWVPNHCFSRNYKLENSTDFTNTPILKISLKET